MLLKVVCHPPGETCQLGGGGEEFCAHTVGIITLPQQRGYFVMQVADDCWPGPTTSEEVIQPQEGLRDFVDSLDIGLADLAAWLA